MKIECRSKAPRVRKFERSLWFENLLPSERLKVVFYTMVCKWQRCNCLWARKFSDVDNDHCTFCFGKYSHDENEYWIQSALCQQLFNEQCIYNISKLNYARWKNFGFFLLKMIFCRTETAFYDRRLILVWAFWHRKNNAGVKGFDPIKIMKSSFSFFRNMQIFNYFQQTSTLLSDRYIRNLSFKSNTVVIPVNLLHIP